MAIEEAVLYLQRCRVQANKWTQRLREAEERFEKLLADAAVQQKLPVDDPTPKPARKPGRQPDEFPTGDNAKALRDVIERGEISAEHLVVLLFGKDERDNRKKVYSRVRFWKRKGWLVKDEDGDWEVAEEVANRLESEDETPSTNDMMRSFFGDDPDTWPKPPQGGEPPE